MKQKLILLVALVLAIVKGLAMPLDTLTTYVSFDKGSTQLQEKCRVEGLMDQIQPVSAIVVNPSSLDFGTVVIGHYVTRTFKVTGMNLTGPLTLNLVTSRSANSDGFSINKTTITAAQAALGAIVKVTYKPTYAGTHNTTTVTISGGGAESQSVTLSGTAVAPAAPSITVTPQAINFGAVEKDMAVIKSFVIKGANLTGPICLNLSGDADMFYINKTTITAEEAANGVTVTAIYKPLAVGTHSATVRISGSGVYASNAVSLTGKCVVPVIYVTPSSLTFTGSGSKTFTVKGTGLTGGLTLTMTGNDSYFNLSRTSISMADAANGVMVVVTCIPKNSQHASAKIIISGGGASPQTVNLNYVNQPVAIDLVEPEGESEGGIEEFTSGVPLEALGNPTTDVNEVSIDAKVYAEGQNIIIESPAEQSAIVSDISGRAQKVNLQAGHNVIPVNTSGVYIVKVGEKTAKLMLK